MERYANQSTSSFSGTIASAGLGAAGMEAAKELSRIEQLLNMAASLVDQAGGLVSRLDSLDARLFGASGRPDEKAQAPTPVRPPIDELQHRLGLAHGLIQRGFDAVNRLDRL